MRVTKDVVLEAILTPANIGIENRGETWRKLDVGDRIVQNVGVRFTPKAGLAVNIRYPGSSFNLAIKGDIGYSFGGPLEGSGEGPYASASLAVGWLH